MKIFRVALIVVLGLTGGCELTGGDDQISHGGQNAVSGEVEGRAVKGVLGQALVQAYAIEDGGLRWLAETTTDKEGYYSLALSGIRGPVLLEVTGAPAATMRCDAISGCGTAAFGEDVPLKDGFRLSTLLLPQEIDRQQVAITPLTHLAAEWVQDMDAEPAEEMVRLARSRVAGVFSVSPEFAFRNLPDVTDARELEASDAMSVGTAVMVAAFQEAAGRWGDAFMEDMSHQFKAYRGQLQRTGDGASLRNLLDAAVAVARGSKGHEALGSIAASLEYLRDHLARGVTSFQAPMLDGESSAFREARRTIAGMASGMDHFGINRDGEFASIRHDEMTWMMRPETKTVFESFGEMLAMSYLVSVLGDLGPGPATVDMYGGMTFTRNYLENRGILLINVNEPGRMIDLRVEVPLARQVLAESRVLEYHAEGVIASGEMVMEIDNDVTVDLMDTNVMPLIIALDTMVIVGGPLTWEDYAQESQKFLDDLHSKFTINGDWVLTNRAMERRLSVLAETIVELDRRNLDGRADLLDVVLGSLSFTDPYGRTVSNAPGSRALHLTIDEDLRLSSGLSLVDKGQPTLEMTYDMTLPGAGERLVSDGPAAVFPAKGANATLELDFPLLSSRYRLTQGDGKVVVSRSHSSETAFEVKALRPGGGIVFADGQVIGTVVIDAYNYSACFLLMDGSDHCMDLGSVNEMQTLPERQVMETLM